MCRTASCYLAVLLGVVLGGPCAPPLSAGQGAVHHHADHIVSPERIDGVHVVDAEGLIEQVMHTPSLVLVDSRIKADRLEGYIEGSISLPDIDTSCTSLAKVIPGLTTPVLFYCNGIRCGRSARAAVIARDCGYTNLYWFRRGMEEWQEKQYPLVQ
jgi:rhodanese-related sulfurtransferase